MGKFIDLTGQRFGRLIVIEIDHKEKRDNRGWNIYWKCDCDCGNKNVVVRGGNLRTTTKSCGCLQKESIVSKNKGQLVKKDLTGIRFEKLLVIDINEEYTKNKKGTYWNCVCDCGNTKIVPTRNLTNGHCQSCGCLKYEKFNDLTGMTFGRWIVLKRDKNQGGNTSWLCECQCGNRKIVQSSLLRNGSSQSCGCLHKEIVSQFEDLSGKTFGQLTVLCLKEIKIDKLNKNNYYYDCLCSCGNRTVRKSTGLQNGTSKSCGCLQLKFASQLNKKGFGEASVNSVYGQYRAKSKKYKIPFDISREDFLFISQQNCHYCGKTPSNKKRSNYDNGDFVYSGIDRIIPSKGYTIENTVPCCIQCNVSKLDYSQQEFYSWIDRVYNHIHSKEGENNGN